MRPTLPRLAKESFSAFVAALVSLGVVAENKRIPRFRLTDEEKINLYRESKGNCCTCGCPLELPSSGDVLEAIRTGLVNHEHLFQWAELCRKLEKAGIRPTKGHYLHLAGLNCGQHSVKKCNQKRTGKTPMKKVANRARKACGKKALTKLPFTSTQLLKTSPRVTI